uniref:Flamingo-like protein FMI-1 (inferred by orthology to a C. elegans protein) n=1 Tax=Strongyloides venezuelensis TaxID=75913 RepID=A0A0K0EWQ0_STRVS
MRKIYWILYISIIFLLPYLNECYINHPYLYETLPIKSQLCIPCSLPQNSTIIYLPSSRPICLHEGHPIFIFSLGNDSKIFDGSKNCEIPYEIKSSHISLDTTNGIVFAKRRMCFYNSNIKIEYRYKCYSFDDYKLSTFLLAHRKFSIPFSGNNTNATTLRYIIPSENKMGRKRTKRWLRRRNPIISPIHFSQEKYNVQISEDAPPKTAIVNIRAEHEKKRSLYYSMSAPEDSRSGDLFALDTVTGQITLVKSLDHESLPKHVLKVTAFERLDPSIISSVLVIIDVVDVQDNPPVFEKTSYFAEIREDAPIGTTVLSVFAQDKDSGDNGKVKYFIQPSPGSENLQINPHSGVVQTVKQLDRETNSLIRLKVFAKDFGSPSFNSSAYVEISILDVNDNIPTFDKNEYHVYINENESVPYSLIQLNVTDNDAEENGKVHFSIITSSGTSFSIDYESGEVTLKEKLNPKMSPYILVVRAKDSGQPALSSRCTIYVHVKDINDHRPLFITFHNEFIIEENVPIGTEVGRVEAIDDDTGLNGEIKYYFINIDQSEFIIDHDTGIIFTNESLDRETIDKYSLEVMAIDQGDAPLNSTIKIQIIIKDINDNIPLFEKEIYEITMPEDVQKGSQILILKANDDDLDTKITYKIEKSDKEIFSLTNLGGNEGALLRLTKSFDADDTNINLLISATDQGGKKGYTTVSINVNDVNQKPYFIKHSFNIIIPEDSPIGFHVTQMKANDNDRGQNANLSFFIDNEDFRINRQTGVITVDKLLDREKQSSYTLKVTVQDNGKPPLSTDTLLEIIIDDVNDNSPVFVEQAYFISIPEDMPVGTSFLQINALDSDSGINAVIDYYLDENDEFVKMDKFRLDRTSGTLRINQKLDRETVETFILPVIAKDRGSPQKTSKTTVTIKLEDVNDNAPQFEKSSYVFYIPENMPPGTMVGKMLATDPDIGDNGNIQFKIFGGADAKYFEIEIDLNKTNAVFIKSRVEFDFEDKINKFQIEVQASSKQLSSTVPVHIFVTDKNDNKPQLRNFIVLITKFNGEYFEEIGNIPAFDPDQNATLEYFLEPNEILSVEKRSGKLKLLKLLNRHVSLQLKSCVSDGSNTECSVCHLRYHPIEEKDLGEAITISINDMTKDEFLDYDVYEKFVSAIASLNNHWTSSDIAVIGIEEKNNTLLISFIINERNEITNTWIIEEMIVEETSNISSLFGRSIELVRDEICNTEPCPYYQQCKQTFKYVGSDNKIIETDSFIYRSFENKRSHICECPPGFGTMFDKIGHCNVKIDMCYESPCKNNGTCHSLENDYRCQCLPGYSGKNCEISSELDTCLPTSCHSDSICTIKNRKPTCQFCRWEKTDTDDNCKLRSISFFGDGYVVVPVTLSRLQWHIKINVATIVREGLIFYAGEMKQTIKRDYFMLYIKNGILNAEISLGNEVAITSMEDSKENRINNGNWRTININFSSRQLVISLDDCDSFLALHHNNTFGYPKCASTTIIKLPKICNDLAVPCNRFFDVKTGLFIGGIKNNKISSNHISRFNGCIKDLYIDDKLIDFSKFSTFEKEGKVIEGCKQKRDVCQYSNPCDSTAKCIDKWGGHICRCHHRVHSKLSCNQESSSAISLFVDGAYGSWKPTNNYEARHIYFEFRTRERNTQVMVIEFEGQAKYFIFNIEGGTIVFNLDNNLYLMQYPVVSDGIWHSISITIDPSTNNFNITIDAIYLKVIPSNENKLIRIINNMHTGQTPTFLGSSKYRGCIRNVEINSYRLKLHSQSKTKPGCQAPNECSTNTCPRFSKCIRDWDRHSCKCNNGYVGDQCVNICSIPNICGIDGICNLKNNTQGYYCLCPDNRIGFNCEQEKVYQICPHGYYGTFPNCKRCSCDLTKGFKDTCNTITGKCECPRNHYVLNGKCTQCECGIGSSSSTCDESGQCPCIGDATGKKCDRCENNLELLDKKTMMCIKLKGRCPSNIESGIQWPTTIFGSTARQSCPFSQIGIAYRKCDTSGVWDMVNLDNCTLKSLHIGNNKLWQIDTIMDVLQLSSLLKNSTKEISYVKGKNIDVWFTIMDTVIKSNSLKDSHIHNHIFAENIVNAASLIAFDCNYSKQMNLIQLLYNFGKKIASIHYDYSFLHPFQISTSNIVFSIDNIDEMDDVNAKYPAPIKLPKFDHFIDRMEESFKNLNIEVSSRYATGTIFYMIYSPSNCDKCESLVVSAYQVLDVDTTKLSYDMGINIAFPIKSHGNWKNYECVRLVNGKTYTINGFSNWNIHDINSSWSNENSLMIGLNSTHVVCQFTGSGIFSILGETVNGFQIQLTSNIGEMPYVHETCGILTMLGSTASLILLFFLKNIDQRGIKTVIVTGYIFNILTVLLIPRINYSSVYCSTRNAIFILTTTFLFSWILLYTLTIYNTILSSNQSISNIILLLIGVVLPPVHSVGVFFYSTTCSIILFSETFWIIVGPIGIVVLAIFYTTTTSFLLTRNKSYNIIGYSLFDYQQTVTQYLFFAIFCVLTNIGTWSKLLGYQRSPLMDVLSDFIILIATVLLFFCISSSPKLKTNPQSSNELWLDQKINSVGSNSSTVLHNDGSSGTVSPNSQNLASNEKSSSNYDEYDHRGGEPIYKSSKNNQWTGKIDGIQNPIENIDNPYSKYSPPNILQRHTTSLIQKQVVGPNILSPIQKIIRIDGMIENINSESIIPIIHGSSHLKSTISKNYDSGMGEESVLNYEDASNMYYAYQEKNNTATTTFRKF